MEAWRLVSMDFIIGLPPDEQKRTDVIILVYGFSMIVHLNPVSTHVTVENSTSIFIKYIFRHHNIFKGYRFGPWSAFHLVFFNFLF